MKRLSPIVLTGLSLTLAFTLVTGCEKKKEEKPAMAPMAPGAPAGHGAPAEGEAPAAHSTAPKTEKKVVIPANVKAAWKKAKITVEDKKAKKSTEYTVGVNSEFQIPGSNLKIKVGDFLPDFTMGEGSYTTASDKPNNPALQVEVFEDGKSIFKGWLFSKFPGMHPFEHAQYGLILKDGVKG